MNTAGWICFASVFDKILFSYETATSAKVNYLSWIFMVMFLPMTPIATYAIEKVGLRFSMLTGLALETLGFWLRVGINRDFRYVMLGQTMITLGSLFIYDMATKLSAVWFPKKERVVSTMVGVNFSIVGNLVGFVLPIIFITSEINLENEFQSKLDLQDEFYHMMLTMAIAETILLASCVILFQDKKTDDEKITRILLINNHNTNILPQVDHHQCNITPTTPYGNRSDASLSIVSEEAI